MIIYNDGTGNPNGSNSLFDVGDITQWKITKTDGSKFQLVSIYLQDPAFGGIPNWTITAYKMV
jgi:hypothetical protein